MGSLLISLIGVLFTVVLMIAGIGYLSPGVGVVVTDTGNVQTEVSGLLADYQNLRTNVQHVPTVTDYSAVYGSHSSNSLYTYGANGVMTRNSSLPGTGSGWTMSQSCNAANNAPCFCLTVTPSTTSTTSNSAVYRSALSAAKKLATGSTSQIAYSTGGCTMTGALQYGGWPDPNTALPTQPYTLVVATVTTPSATSCSCTQGATTYSCGTTWETDSSNSRNCTADPSQPTPPWTSGTETQATGQPYSCVEQSNGTGSIVTGTPYTSAWNTSNCVAATTAACLTTPPPPSSTPPSGNLCSVGTSSTPQLSGLTWAWVCTGAGGSTANCTSVATVDGQCNTATTGSSYTNTVPPATSALCSSGTPGSTLSTNVSGYTWTCTGTSGINQNCSAPGTCANAGSVPAGGTISAFPNCQAGCNGSLTYNATTNTCYCQGVTSTSWIAPTNLCNGVVAQTNYGATTTVSNVSTNINYTGSELATCGSTGFTYSNPTCTPVPCTATTNSYGKCGFVVAGLASGQQENLNSTTGTTTPTTTAGYSGTETAACTTGVWSYSNQNCTAVSAACNSFSASASAPTGALCASGTASSVTQSGTNWAWTCTDVAGDTPTSCTSPDILAGACGSDNHGTFSDLPWNIPADIAGTCLGGYANLNLGSAAFPSPGEVTWTCNGPNGGTKSGTCAACLTGFSWNGSSCVTLPAQCNSFSASASAPTGTLCASGTPSSVGQSGNNWVWTCTDAANDPPVSCTSPDSIPGQCGSDNGGTFAAAPWTLNNNACQNGNGSVAYEVPIHNGGGTNGWSWLCYGPNGGRLSVGCDSCLTGYVWNSAAGVCQTGAASCSYFPPTAAPGPTGTLCSSGTASTVSQSGTNWAWTCTDAVGDPPVQCISPVSTRGACGSDNHGTFTTAPWLVDNNACAAGSQYAAAGAWTGVGFTWQCGGPNNSPLSGTCTSCITGYVWNGTTCLPIVNGQCGSAVDTCDAGTVTSPISYGTYSQWTCDGSSNGGTNSSLCGQCNSGYAWNGSACAAIVNGQCGTAVNTCAAGTVTSSTSYGSYSQWTCDGSNGGSNSSLCTQCNSGYAWNGSACAATALVNGICNNSVRYGCSAGTSANPTDTGSESFWDCLGANGGVKASPSCGMCDPGYAWNGQACASTSANNCAATTNTYGNCSFNIGALASGQSETPSTTTPNYAGSETATCNNGSWSYTGQSCAPSCPTGQYWNGSSCLTGCVVQSYMTCSSTPRYNIPPPPGGLGGNYSTGATAPFGLVCAVPTEKCVPISTYPYVFCTDGYDECVFYSSTNTAQWTNIGCYGGQCGGVIPIEPPACPGGANCP